MHKLVAWYLTLSWL